jgi:phosphate transport system permease protein
MKPPTPHPDLFADPSAPAAGRRRWLRGAADKLFTGAAVASVAAIAAVLAVVLAPMLWRGAGAIVFDGTVEFRKMQMEQFDRGDPAAVAAEAARADAARRPVYERLDRFKQGLDADGLQEQARRTNREFGRQLEARALDEAERGQLRSRARRVRDALCEAFASTDKAEAGERLQEVLQQADDPDLKGTLAENLFEMARRYQHVLTTVDLAHREKYGPALREVEEAVRRLFGPRPGEPKPPLVMDGYGATRKDMAERQLHRLLTAETWVEVEPGRPLQKRETPREEQFAGTDLEALFPLVRDRLDEMLLPEQTVYWQYFIDDDRHSGHYIGGVGPEILGTLMLTLLAVAVALPLGVISAAYLVEVAPARRRVVLLRTFINTLAGVPSIVFGLFGVAFFLLYVQPRLGLASDSTILAGGLTLGLLVLPVVIRASEEAIRAVPAAYKEAALSLGAGGLRCFVTVTLPAALPGILTGVILSVSRAAGETAPILFTAAVAIGPAPWPPWSALVHPTPALSYACHHMATGDRLAMDVPHNQYGMVMTLIALVLVLNLAAILLRWKVSRRLRGH